MKGGFLTEAGFYARLHNLVIEYPAIFVYIVNVMKFPILQW